METALSPADLRALLPACLEAVGEAGAAVLEVYRAGFTVDRKKDLSPITEADRRSHRLLTARLAALAVPGGRGAAGGLPVLSEEGNPPPYSERRRWRRFWLVDPLDGTKEFVKRNGEFTVNVALVEGRSPVFGIVYAPVADLLYYGIRGLGAWCIDSFGRALADPGGADPGGADSAGANPAAGRAALLRRLAEGARRLEPPPAQPLPLPADRGRAAAGAGPPAQTPAAPATLASRLRAMAASPPSSAEAMRERIRVIGSRSHSGLPFRRYVRKLRRVAREVEVTLMGGSLKMCFVAEGRADIYPRFGPTMEWDTAAPHAVLAGVGRGIRRMDSGEELLYNKEDLRNPWFVAG